MHLSVHLSIARGRRFGHDSWTARVARRHGLESTLSQSLAATEGREDRGIADDKAWCSPFQRPVVCLNVIQGPLSVSLLPGVHLLCVDS